MFDWTRTRVSKFELAGQRGVSDFDILSNWETLSLPGSHHAAVAQHGIERHGSTMSYTVVSKATCLVFS